MTPTGYKTLESSSRLPPLRKHHPFTSWSFPEPQVSPTLGWVFLAPSRTKNFPQRFSGLRGADKEPVDEKKQGDEREKRNETRFLTTIPRSVSSPFALYFLETASCYPRNALEGTRYQLVAVGIERGPRIYGVELFILLFRDGTRNRSPLLVPFLFSLRGLGTLCFPLTLEQRNLCWPNVRFRG